MSSVGFVSTPTPVAIPRGEVEREALGYPRSVGRLVRAPHVRPVRPGFERVKRAFDLVVTLSCLPLAALVMGAIALLVLLEDGRPVFFCQMRTGKGGRRFRLHKFRTMVRDADTRKAELASSNRQSGPDFKIVDDPRVTRVGGWLRRTSLDELPQLFDVLRGHMSLVGPRPTSFEAARYDLWHTERLEVRPGLTGLWQVSGRADVDFDQRVRLDIQYIENRSFFLDFSIILRTFRVLFDHRGAY